jgi:flavin-binding protein dodecin
MTIVSNQPTLVARTRVPISDIDPYSDEVLIGPWDAYRKLQNLAAAATSIRDLRVAEVVKMDMKVEDGKVTAFRTRVALSFKYEAS